MADLDVKMAITSQSERRKNNTGEGNDRKGDKKIIKIEEEGGTVFLTYFR